MINMNRIFKSPNYNYLFNTKTGFFARWGKTEEDNPEYSPFGPELMDIEISTICSRACSWCYKSNTSNGKYMSLDMFKQLFNKFPKMLTQIAFGIGDIEGNPDLWNIMEHCRINQIIPNITINGDNLTKKQSFYLSRLCGAVAVSLYDYDICYSAVQSLTSKGLKQVNIHALLCEETYDKCMKLIEDSKTDSRLKNLNAIVFLWLKPKGNRNQFTQITSLAKYKALVDHAFEKRARVGFDSCSASSFLKVVKDRQDYKQLEMMVEPCESTLFSYYINVDGMGYPCSFTEGQEGYKSIDVLNVKDFLKDVWFNKETKNFRQKVVNNKNCMGCRVCQAFDLELV